MSFLQRARCFMDFFGWLTHNSAVYRPDLIVPVLAVIIVLLAGVAELSSTVLVGVQVPRHFYEDRFRFVSMR